MVSFPFDLLADAFGENEFSCSRANFVSEVDS